MRKRLAHLFIAFVALIGSSVVATLDASADDTKVYTQPGHHYVNGRWWSTECEMYSTTVVRCTTDIWATKVVSENGRYTQRNGWVFNNLTYLPSAQSTWEKNPLGFAGEWTAEDGRRWKTECNTAETGQGGCRSWALADVVSYQDGRYVTSQEWVFNNIVQFSTATVPAQTTIPAAAPPIDGVPVEDPEPALGPVVGPCRASYYTMGHTTANGEAYNPDGLTAAHKSLPFGTELVVTNQANGKSVTVRINDRGPFVGDRCLDLSRGAMRAVDGINAGVITVTWREVQ